MANKHSIDGYKYNSAELNHSHGYLLPVVLRSLRQIEKNVEKKHIFDLGCGNGSVASELTRLGWKVTGVDPSVEGIDKANKAYPDIDLTVGSAYDDLEKIHGKFSVLLSLEVIEHLYAPREYIRCISNLLEPGGSGIISTPYHGYLKNLALALTGNMDRHYTALWDHGHIKFWSQKTLSHLLEEAGFEKIKFFHAGRIPYLSKSMVAIFRKPCI